MTNHRAAQNPVDLAQSIMRVVEGSDYETIQYSLRIAGVIAEHEFNSKFQRGNPTVTSGQ